MEGGRTEGAGCRAGSWFLVVHGEKKEVIIGDLKFAEEEISNSLKVLINLSLLFCLHFKQVLTPISTWNFAQCTRTQPSVVMG